MLSFSQSPQAFSSAPSLFRSFFFFPHTLSALYFSASQLLLLYLFIPLILISHSHILPRQVTFNTTQPSMSEWVSFPSAFPQWLNVHKTCEQTSSSIEYKDTIQWTMYLKALKYLCDTWRDVCPFSSRHNICCYLTNGSLIAYWTWRSGAALHISFPSLPLLSLTSPSPYCFQSKLLMLSSQYCNPAVKLNSSQVGMCVTVWVYVRLLQKCLHQAPKVKVKVIFALSAFHSRCSMFRPTRPAVWPPTRCPDLNLL